MAFFVSEKLFCFPFQSCPYRLMFVLHKNTLLYSLMQWADRLSRKRDKLQVMSVKIFIELTPKISFWAKNWKKTFLKILAFVEFFSPESGFTIWEQSCKIFYNCNLQLFGKSWSVCTWQAFPAYSNKQFSLVQKSVNYCQ